MGKKSKSPHFELWTFWFPGLTPPPLFGLFPLFGTFLFGTLPLLFLFSGEYDPAEIHNAGQLKRHMMYVCIHLGWQMVSFFLFLYCLLDSVMQEQVVIPMDDDVTVLNRPVETKYYSPPPHHDHPDTHRDYDFWNNEYLKYPVVGFVMFCIFYLLFNFIYTQIYFLHLTMVLLLWSQSANHNLISSLMCRQEVLKLNSFKVCLHSILWSSHSQPLYLAMSSHVVIR